MKFLKKGKLILYSNNDANEFAIKKGSEEEFKAVSSNSAKYTEVIAELKIGSEGGVTVFCMLDYVFSNI